MFLVDKIKQIYPELANYNFATSDIELRNDSDGKGDYIARWNHPTLAQPTQEDLDGISS
jgi:hypothetical protein